MNRKKFRADEVKIQVRPDNSLLVKGPFMLIQPDGAEENIDVASFVSGDILKQGTALTTPIRTLQLSVLSPSSLGRFNGRRLPGLFNCRGRTQKPNTA